MDGPAHPSLTGARSEAAIASALVAAGHTVFLPAFAAHSRIDLVYLAAGRAVRVQCKTARTIGGALRFRTCSNTANHPRAYADEVDEFGVFAPSTGAVYLVPATGLGQRACDLRLAPTRNGQSRNVRWAADFELRPPCSVVQTCQATVGASR